MLLSSLPFCQKISKLFDGHESYSMPSQCRFFETQCRCKHTLHYLLLSQTLQPKNPYQFLFVSATCCEQDFMLYDTEKTFSSFRFSFLHKMQCVHVVCETT